MTKQDMIFLAVVLAILVPLAYGFDRRNISMREKCESQSGVWFQREMKCIVGKEIKV